MEEDTVISNECIFRNVLDTCSINKRDRSKELSATQKSKVVRCSDERQDEFHTKNNSELSAWKYHVDCYSTNTSRERIRRYLKKKKRK